MNTQLINPGRPVFNMGLLRSDIELTLHTYHAARLWTGRKPKTGEKHQGVLGLTGYIHFTGRISRASSEDDPYADWMLIQIEEKLDQATARIKTIREEVSGYLAQLPSQLKITENLNLSPARITLYVNTPVGFQGVYLLIQFDELVRDLLLAQHIGLMGREMKETMINQGAHQIRSLFALTQNYRHTGVARDDIAANNAKARDAAEKYGLPPDDVVQGLRRSKYSLPIRKNAASTSIEDEYEIDAANNDDNEEAAPAVEEADTPVAAAEEEAPVKKSRKKAANV